MGSEVEGELGKSPLSNMSDSAKPTTGLGEGNKPDPEKKLKPCCACPETKKARDECMIQNGEEGCGDLIEAHKECLRKHGFKV